MWKPYFYVWNVCGFPVAWWHERVLHSECKRFKCFGWWRVFCCIIHYVGFTLTSHIALFQIIACVNLPNVTVFFVWGWHICFLESKAVKRLQPFQRFLVRLSGESFKRFMYNRCFLFIKRSKKNPSQTKQPLRTILSSSSGEMYTLSSITFRWNIF